MKFLCFPDGEDTNPVVVDSLEEAMSLVPLGRILVWEEFVVWCGLE